MTHVSVSERDGLEGMIREQAVSRCDPVRHLGISVTM